MASGLKTYKVPLNKEHAQELVLINSFPGNTKFLYTSEKKPYQPRENAGKAKQREMLGKLIQADPKITKEFAEMVRTTYPQYTPYLDRLEYFKEPDLKAYIDSHKDSYLSSYWVRNFIAEKESASKTPKPVISESGGNSEALDASYEYSPGQAFEEQTNTNQEVLKALDEETRLKNEQAAKALADNIKAQKEGKAVQTPVFETSNPDILTTVQETVDLEPSIGRKKFDEPSEARPEPPKPLANNMLPGWDNEEFKQPDFNSVGTNDSYDDRNDKGEQQRKQQGVKQQVIFNALSESILKGIQEGRSTTDIDKLMDDLIKGGVLDASATEEMKELISARRNRGSGVGSDNSSDSSTVVSDGSRLTGLADLFVGSQGSSEPPGSGLGLDSASGSGGSQDPNQGQSIDQTKGDEPTPVTQFGAPAVSRPPEIAIKYHKIPIKLFFGSDTNPEWDTNLEQTIRDLPEDKSVFADMIDGIISSNGPKILVSKRKSEGDTQELVEILELHFSLERNMAKGSRSQQAMVSIGSLIKERDRLAGVNVNVSVAPGGPDSGAGSQSGPGDLGVFDQVDEDGNPIKQDPTQVQAQAQVQGQEPGADPEQKQFTLDQAKENIIEKWRERPYVNGKPIVTKPIDSLIKQMTFEVANKKLTFASARDPTGVDVNLVARNKVGALIKSSQTKSKKKHDCCE